MSTLLQIGLFGDWAPERTRLRCSFPEADLLMFNLEGPVFMDPPPAKMALKKAGPHIWNRSLPTSSDRSECSPATFLYSLANNHFMDYGLAGMRSSIDAIVGEGGGGIYCGAGETIEESRKPAIFKKDGITVTLYGVCEPQFGVARLGGGGVAEQGPWLYSRISEAKSRGEVVGISVHGGQEDIPIPSPKRVEFFRSLIDSGADFVWGHHSHVPQVWEFYGGKLIAYGLGNLAVDPIKWSRKASHRRSLAFLGSATSLGLVSWEVGHASILVSDNSAFDAEIKVTYSIEGWFSALSNLSKTLMDRQQFEALWQEYAFSLFEDFGEDFMGWSRNNPRQVASDFLRGKKESISRRALLRYHMVANHAHREMLETVLGVMAGEIIDHRTAASKLLFAELTIETSDSS